MCEHKFACTNVTHTHTHTHTHVALRMTDYQNSKLLQGDVYLRQIHASGSKVVPAVHNNLRYTSPDLIKTWNESNLILGIYCKQCFLQVYYILYNGSKWRKEIK